MRRRELRDRVLVTLSDAAESLAGRLSIDRPEPHASTRLAAATEVLLVVSPHAGGSKGLQRARRAISEQGIVVTEAAGIGYGVPAVTTLISFVIPPMPARPDTASNAASLSVWCLTCPFRVSHPS